MGAFIEKFKIREKLKVIFIPFILLEIISIGLFTFLRCHFSDKLFELKISEGTLDLILSFIAPLPPIWLWLLPRMRRFYLPNKISGYSSLYWILIILCFTLMLAVLPIQDYIIDVNGGLTDLNDISQVNQLKKTKYYTLKNFYVDKKYGSIFEKEEATRSGTLMLIYMTFPIFEKQSDTINYEVKAWLGIKYLKYRVSQQDKTEFRRFAEESQVDFNKKDLRQFAYLERVGYSDDQFGFNEARGGSKYFTVGNDLVLIPVNTPYSQRGRMSLIMGIFIAALGTFLSLLLTLTLMLGTLNEEAMARYLSTGKTS